MKAKTTITIEFTVDEKETMILDEAIELLTKVRNKFTMQQLPNNAAEVQRAINLMIDIMEKNPIKNIE